MEGSGSIVQSMAASCCQRQAESCRYDCDRARDGSSGLSPVRFSRRQRDNSNALDPSSRRTKPNASSSRRRVRPEAGQRLGILETCYEPTYIYARPLRTRQPETEPRSCGNQPAHESLLTGVFSLCLLPCAPVYCLRSASRRREPASGCLDSEHESRMMMLRYSQFAS